ncbi:MAG: exo-alpha-sialidase, partial [Bryobacterales bacterium]|nr:exo-alpha-sialidase [Bryobacterales bacterium]
MLRRRMLLAGAAAPLAAQSVSEQLEREMRRSAPDYVAYKPGHYDGSTHDGLNEHFLVFDGPDGSMMAIWTQSDKGAGMPGARQKNRIRFSRSTDEGRTWQTPTHVVGPRTQDD